MKSNILFVGLNYEFIKKISKEICDGFDMFFLDVNALIEYNLAAKQNIEELCGIDYLNKEREAIILSVNNYENSVVCVPYSIFLENGIAKELKNNAIVVYLKLPKKVLNKQNETEGGLLTECIAFEEFDKLLAKNADVVVKCKNDSVKDCINLTLEELKRVLL